MREDEPHEWGLSAFELKDILETGKFSGPSDRAREAAKAAGWEFATNSLLSFIRCPCCKSGRALIDAEDRRQAVGVIAELLEDDEDAMVSMLEDMPPMMASLKGF